MAHKEPGARGDLFGMSLVIASACAYGTVPIFAKRAFADGASLAQFLTIRFSIATALLWAAVVLLDRRVPRRADSVPLLLMGALGYGGQSAAFFLALERLPASTTALLLYTYPAIVTVFAALVLRDRLTVRKIAAVAIAFCGTALVVRGPLGAMDTTGVLCALLSASIYSAYILFGSGLFRRVPPIAGAATVMSGTTAFYFAGALATGGLSMPAGSSAMALIAGVAVIGTAIPVLAFLSGMPRIGPSRASILSTFEPAVTVLLAGIVLGEGLATAQAIGAACVLASVVVLEYGRTDEPAPM